MEKESYFYVGQTVYHHDFGKGEVISVNNHGYYTVSVIFGLMSIVFSHDGRLSTKRGISLSQTPLPEIVNKPIINIKPLDLYWIKDEWGMWVIRFAKSYDCTTGELEVYVNGLAGGNTMKRLTFKKYDPETVHEFTTKRL